MAVARIVAGTAAVGLAELVGPVAGPADWIVVVGFVVRIWVWQLWLLLLRAVCVVC